MKIYKLHRTQFLPISQQEAWVFFSSPQNLALITPKKMNFEILSVSGNEKIHGGQIIHYKVTVLPMIRLRWITEITNVQEPYFFVDEQRRGPYSLWRHRHNFKPVSGGIEMTDDVEYAIPFGIIGRCTHSLFVKREVESIFTHRMNILSKIFIQRDVGTQ